MADELRLELLGGLRLTRGGVPLGGFRSRKVAALLAYLAATGRAHPREALAGLLWGELLEAFARASLRQALFNLHRLVGDHLAISRATVALRPEGLWLDVAAFEAAVGPAGDPPGAAPDPARLAAAVALYQGDLLAGFGVPDAPAFDEWLAGQRERLRHPAVQVMHALAGWHSGRADYPAGIAVLERLLALEPRREEAHRHLMRLLAASR